MVPAASRPTLLLLGLLILTGAFTGCATLPPRKAPALAAYGEAIRQQGFTPYYPPRGETSNPQTFEKYGPGAIIRTRQQTYYYPASVLVKKVGVTAAMAPAHQTSVALFDGQRVSGYAIDGQGGWTLDAVNRIRGALDARRLTTTEIEFGPAYVTDPLSGSDFDDALTARLREGEINPTARQALARGEFVIVQDALYVASMRFHLKRQSEAGGEVALELTAQEIAALQARGFSIVEGGVELRAPTFIGYRPLPGVPALLAATPR